MKAALRSLSSNPRFSAPFLGPSSQKGSKKKKEKKKEKMKERRKEEIIEEGPDPFSAKLCFDSESEEENRTP